MVGAISTQSSTGEIPLVTQQDERTVQSSSPQNLEAIEIVAQKALESCPPSDSAPHIKVSVTALQVVE